jgi:FkbM family methyltransferase
VLDSDESLYVELFFKTFRLKVLTLLDVGSSVGRFSKGFITAARKYGVYVSDHRFEPRYGGPAVGENVGKAEFSFLVDVEHSHVTRPPGYQAALDEFCDNLGIPHVGFVLDRIEEVEMTTVDKYLELLPPVPVFLKIDTEGHELAVLKGAKKSMAAKKVYGIQFEYGGTWINQGTLKEAFDLLEGFDLWQYTGADIEPLLDTEDDYWRSCNFLALLRR